MEIEKLNEWNPWWEDISLLEKLKGKERPIYKLLLNSIKIKEITIITGVRRSGKSTLMYQMISNLLKTGIKPKQILFVNLEDKKLIENSLDDIYLSYRENINADERAFIFLDEIHKKDGWESWIRKKYDLKTEDKFVISGSCSYLLKKEYSTLLTGRNITFEVFPLNFREFLLFKNIEIDVEKIKGRVVLEKTKILIKKELKNYFDYIIYKDIVDRFNLNSQKTKDIALFFMTNFTSLASLRNIRNSLKISYDTVKDYLSYFKEAFLFFTLDHLSYSFKEQKTRASKVYCMDNGLRNAV